MASAFLTACVPGPKPFYGLSHIKPVHQKQPGIQAVTYQKALRIIVSSDHLFKLHTAQLMHKKNKLLNQALAWIHRYPGATIEVLGYTDSIGTDQEKRQITEGQARRVASYLWAHGIAWERLHIGGQGDHEPVASDSSLEAHAMNRRVEIWVRYR